MIVLKFGGTSVASADRLRSVKEILLKYFDNEDRVIVVVSAFSGVTDLLISSADLAESGDDTYIDKIDSFFQKSHTIAKDLLSDESYNKIKKTLVDNHSSLKSLLSGVFLIQEASQKTRDYILSFGERNCAFIFSNYLIEQGISAEYIDARNYIKTDDSFGKAQVDFKETNKLIQDKFLNFKGIGVVTGFIGSDSKSGRTTTLGRGGSDFTAAIFASATDAKELQIWTDVSGVLTCDPRKVKKAYSIKELSYSEAMELSHFGAKVLYYPTIRPVKQKGIPTRIKNTFAPEDVGTLIHDNAPESQNLISGLSSINDISIISLEGLGLQGVSGTANRLFRSLAEGNINVIMITQASSEHSISLAISEDQVDAAKTRIDEEFKNEIKRKLVYPAKVEKNLCLMAVVGENMKDQPGVSGKLFSTLGKNGINIEAIAQGSSELNITFAIHSKDQIKALNTIHDSFFLSEHKTIHLFIVGVGLIGSKLLEQISENHSKIKENLGLEIVVNGISNSRKMVINNDGLDLSSYKGDLEKGRDADLSSFISQMVECNFAHTVFIDNTASPLVPEHYLEILKNNIAISTPNKIALSADLKDYNMIKGVAKQYNTPILFETNVGAGLPVISTLKNMVDSGDFITKIEAVLSGSLSYIFNTFDGSQKFSDVVKDAKAKGFTEPDPRDDLSGADVKRKILILAREAGYNIENHDIEIDSMLSEEAKSAEDVNAFLSVLEKEDNHFAQLYKDAKLKNQKLRFIATFDGYRGKIALTPVNSDSPFYGLGGSDNMIAFYSERYNNTPLVVRGPGAGADVTAAGVLSEIINVGKVL